MIDCPLYRAEHIAWAKNPAFMGVVENAQAFVDFVCNDEWDVHTVGSGTSSLFRGLRRVSGLPQAYITVTRGARQQTSCSLARVFEGHIDLGPGPVCNGLLLHEIAHLCTPTNEAHSRLYCSRYLQLVRHFLGELAAVDLKHAMERTGAF